MSKQDLFAHLAEGAAHVCRCWRIARRDGVVMGFTDHDRPLRFDGTDFRPDSGLSARSLVQANGLGVDNSEAVGLLQSDAIRDEDIVAGRYDAAEVTAWLVRWDRVADRQIRFRGHIGEITREGPQFRAELRGLAEGLNRPVGRSFLRSCSAVLGDRACGVDLGDARLSRETTILSHKERRIIRVEISDTTPRFFEQGRVEFLDGAGAGLSATIKHHDTVGGRQRLTLWEAVPAQVRAGDRVRLTAGCDKRAETCREKFLNFVNFQGFPHLPSDDWVAAVPRADTVHDGGSLQE